MLHAKRLLGLSLERQQDVPCWIVSDKAVLQFLAPVPFAVVLLGRAFPLLLFLKLARSLVHGGPVYRWMRGPVIQHFFSPVQNCAKKYWEHGNFLVLKLPLLLSTGATAWSFLLKLQMDCIKGKYQAESQHLNYQQPSCLSSRRTLTPHNYFKTLSWPYKTGS